MSYDISLCDPVTHKPLKADSTHFIAGGMRAMGGTKELWLNVTYNYGQFYYRPEVFGEGGIRSIYGKTGAESIPMLEKAISALGDDVDDSDYWNATEGNAKRALYGLLAFAKMRCVSVSKNGCRNWSKSSLSSTPIWAMRWMMCLITSTQHRLSR